MSNYNTYLDTSSKKNRCPYCHQKTLTLYLTSDKKEIINENVGRCDRENKCGYHYPPKQFYADNNITFEKGFQFPNTKGMETGNLPLTPTEYLPLDALKRSVESHTRCDLYPFFDSKFRAAIATELCKKYFIGANRNGNTVYWQVDIAGNVRQAKIIKYDSEGN